MSGGSLDYIQYKDVEDLLENSNLDINFEAAAKELEEYGEVGKSAQEMTETFLTLLKSVRERHQREREELGSAIPQELRDVWRQLDYEGSNDVSKDDVRKALIAFNEKQAKS